jgi:hypothetical protein
MVILIALNLGIIVIVIGLEIWMIERALYIFFFYMEDTTLIWSLKKQSIITLSTCEAKYVVTTSCVCHSANEII